VRKTSLLALLLLAATGTHSNAGGLNLSWSECATDGGTQNRTFACDTNTGAEFIAGSFALDQDVLHVNGNELVVDLYFTGTTVPEWWKFKNAGTCRQTALTIAAQDGTNCPDQFLGWASMNIAAYQVGLNGPNFARILCVNFVALGLEADLTGGQEYGIARWRIVNTKTVGTGSCGGCIHRTMIVFNSANITTESGVSDTKLTTSASPASNVITWQDGLVPTRKSSWTAVKSLYR